MAISGDSPIIADINVPRGVNMSKLASMIPPGMGELNYIQSLLAGLIDQSLYTTSSPTFVGLTLSGLTASALVGTDANKLLQTVNPGTSLSLSGTSLNTIQGIRTADSPAFAGLTIGSVAGILKAAAGVVGAATIGTSLSYAAPTLNTIQGIRTADSPQFSGLTLSVATNLLMTMSCGATGRWNQIKFDRGGTNVSYIGPNSGNELVIQTAENIPFILTLNSAEVLRVTAAGLINPKAITSIGLINPARTFHLRLICGSALLADRNLTFTTGDAARTITLSGNPTLSDWFDQAVKAASSPTFAGATIGSLAGILTGAAGVMGATALGAADLKLFMNAAGTGLEWVKGMKTGVFTRDLTTASGTQAITGVGFKPSQGLFLCGLNGAGAMSVGISDGTNNYMVVLIGVVGYLNNASSVRYFVDLLNYQVGVVSTWGSDGFTITWTKVGSPTGTLYVAYQVYR